MTEREKQVFDALSAQCAKREYCTADVRRKALQRLEFDAAAAEAVVSALVAEGYADDRRYAAAYAREKSALAGWGPVKIRTTLLARGVPREVAVEALGEIDADRAAATQLLNDRLGEAIRKYPEQYLWAHRRWREKK